MQYKKKQTSKHDLDSQEATAPLSDDQMVILMKNA